MPKPSHMAIFPNPGMGHLIPLVQFAKRLSTLHRLTATFIVLTDGPISKAQKTFLDTLSSGLDYVVLPQVNLDDLSYDVMIETRICIMISRSLPSLCDTFKLIHATKKMASFVVDVFVTDALDAKRYRLVEGIIVNSFMDLERGAIKALQELGSPPIYPVGALIQMHHSSSGADGLDCLRWLDNQPSGSVLFISFGSGGTLTSNQITELALGLEMSEQRFLWVIRRFTERTKSQGLVVPHWAPQAQILSHGSTGGFLTHCGWNSILESVVNGVPMISWPLFAEQKMNAITLSEDLKVALRPQVGENDLVESVEIAKVVNGLMEGEEGKHYRTKMIDLKDVAAKVLSDDGSSKEVMAQVASKWFI
ncbi:hypothetical protein AgCh_016447 [Apium graveolens]